MKILVFIAAICVFASESNAASKQGRFRVLGGRPAKPKEFPFAVSIHNIPDDKFTGTGVLVSCQHVLSAANCFFDEIYSNGTPASNCHVYINGDAGLTAYQGVASNKLIIKVESCILDPQWDWSKHDLALGFLEKKITHNEIGPISVFAPTMEEIFVELDKLRETKTTCLLLGWGSVTNLSDQISSKRLHVTTMLPIDDSTCTTEKCKLNPTLCNYNLRDNYQFCTTGVRKSGACFSDKGSPLVCNNFLTGILGVLRMYCEDPQLYAMPLHFLERKANFTFSKTETFFHVTARKKKVNVNQVIDNTNRLQVSYILQILILVAIVL